MNVIRLKELATRDVGFRSDEFSWIQDVIWIERFLQPAMKITCHRTRRFRPPAFFCQTDSVFACNHAAPCQHSFKQIVERALHTVTYSSVAIVPVCHDVDVNVAVTSVTKAGNRESMLCLHR